MRTYPRICSNGHTILDASGDREHDGCKECARARIRRYQRTAKRLLVIERYRQSGRQSETRRRRYQAKASDEQWIAKKNAEKRARDRRNAEARDAGRASQLQRRAD